MGALELLQTIVTHGGSATLKPDEKGGFKINVVPTSLAMEFLPELRRLKPALVELMRAASLLEQSPDSSPFSRISECVWVPDHLPPIDVQERLHREALAREIIAAAYLDETLGVWKIDWATGRHAWQRWTRDQGGALDEVNGLPSVEAAQCIDWARLQFLPTEATTDSCKTNTSQFPMEAAA